MTVLVEEAMSTDVVTVDVDATLHEAVERMLRERVGSVVVEDDGPTGIVTETDVLMAGYRAERPFADVAVATAMSSPLVTVDPTTTVRAASEKMREERVKKLPVAEDFDLVGILTTADVVANQSELLQEAGSFARERGTWSID